jgi:hypothetical protein
VADVVAALVRKDWQLTGANRSVEKHQKTHENNNIFRNAGGPLHKIDYLKLFKRKQ